MLTQQWSSCPAQECDPLLRIVLTAAAQAIANSDADGLTAAKLDRVARSVIDFASRLAWVHERRENTPILDPAIDTSSASGRLVANVFAAVAEWEGDTISERTTQAL